MSILETIREIHKDSSVGIMTPNKLPVIVLFCLLAQYHCYDHGYDHGVPRHARFDLDPMTPPPKHYEGNLYRDPLSKKYNVHRVNCRAGFLYPTQACIKLFIADLDVKINDIVDTLIDYLQFTRTFIKNNINERRLAMTLHSLSPDEESGDYTHSKNTLSLSDFLAELEKMIRLRKVLGQAQKESFDRGVNGLHPEVELKAEGFQDFMDHIHGHATVNTSFVDSRKDIWNLRVEMFIAERNHRDNEKLCWMLQSAIIGLSVMAFGLIALHVAACMSSKFKRLTEEERLPEISLRFQRDRPESHFTLL